MLILMMKTIERDLSTIQTIYSVLVKKQIIGKNALFLPICIVKKRPPIKRSNVDNRFESQCRLYLAIEVGGWFDA